MRENKNMFIPTQTTEIVSRINVLAHVPLYRAPRIRDRYIPVLDEWRRFVQVTANGRYV